MLRIAFVGCGIISSLHLSAALSTGRIIVTAAVDLDAERAKKFAQTAGCSSVFSTLDEALAARKASLATGTPLFDAVDLMVPHHLHEELAIKVLEAGVHLLLEKPLATTVEAAERILKCAKDHPEVVFMLGEQSQYWPEILKAKELVQAGAIGEIVTAHAAYLEEVGADLCGKGAGGADTPQTEETEILAARSHNWRYQLSKAGGGCCIDGGSHWIRPLRMMMGEIDELVAVTGRPLPVMEGESLAHAIFRFRNGKTAAFETLVLDTVLAPKHPYWKFTGTKGEIIILKQGLYLYNQEHRDGKLMMSLDECGYAKAFPGQFSDFAAAVQHRRPLAAGPEQGLGELRVALAICRSSRCRTWEKVW